MAFDAPVTEITAAEQTVLCRRFGFSELRSHQIAAISAMSAGYDCLLTVSTGGGKSEAILGAKLLHPERGVHVQIEPLRALQADMLTRMKALGLRVELLNSDLSAAQFESVLSKVQQGTVDCLLTTPEQLEKPVDRIEKHSDILQFINTLRLSDMRRRTRHRLFRRQIRQQK